MGYANARRARRDRDRKMFGETSALARDALMITHWPGHSSVYVGLESLGYVAGPPEWARALAQALLEEADRAEASAG